MTNSTFSFTGDLGTEALATGFECRLVDLFGEWVKADGGKEMPEDLQAEWGFLFEAEPDHMPHFDVANGGLEARGADAAHGEPHRVGGFVFEAEPLGPGGVDHAELAEADANAN